MGKSFPDLEVLKPFEETNASGTSGSGTGYGTGSGSDSISNFDSVSIVSKTNMPKRLQHETNLSQTWTPRTVQIPASEDFRPARERFGSQERSNDLSRHISAQDVNTILTESPHADYIMPRPANDENLRSRFRVKHNFDANEVCSIPHATYDMHHIICSSYTTEYLTLLFQYGDGYLTISIGEVVSCNSEEFATSEAGWIEISKISESISGENHGNNSDNKITGLVPVNYLEPFESHTDGNGETLDSGRSNFTFE